MSGIGTTLSTVADRLKLTFRVLLCQFLIQFLQSDELPNEQVRHFSNIKYCSDRKWLRYTSALSTLKWWVRWHETLISACRSELCSRSLYLSTLAWQSTSDNFFGHGHRAISIPVERWEVGSLLVLFFSVFPEEDPLSLLKLLILISF